MLTSSSPTDSFTIVEAKPPTIVINLSRCRYSCVKQAAEELGWRVSFVCDEDTSSNNNNSNSKKKKNRDWVIYWMDATCTASRVFNLASWQKINHFPSMNQICRKISLCRNMKIMQEQFPKSYRFYPHSWVLPHEFYSFSNNKKTEGRIFIVKPNASCQGKGIVVTSDKSEVEKYGDCVVQLYVDRPFLINGFKFDLRVYIFVKSIKPLRIYFYREGLVRMCTEKWTRPSKRNLKNSFMHLTNYAINKKNNKFVQSEDGTGSKKNFQFLTDYVTENGHNAKKMWKRIKDICVKTIISILPTLRKTYKNCSSDDTLKEMNNYICFEILGFDIMLDDKLNPWLLEVNHSPSFSTDSGLDYSIKFPLIKETMNLLGVENFEKQKFQSLQKILVMNRLLKNDDFIENEDGTYTSLEDLKELFKMKEAWHESVEEKYLNLYEKIFPAKEGSKDAKKFDKFIKGVYKVSKSIVRSRYSEMSLNLNSKKTEKKRSFRNFPYSLNSFDRTFDYGNLKIRPKTSSHTYKFKNEKGLGKRIKKRKKSSTSKTLTKKVLSHSKSTKTRKKERMKKRFQSSRTLSISNKIENSKKKSQRSSSNSNSNRVKKKTYEPTSDSRVIKYRKRYRNFTIRGLVNESNSLLGQYDTILNESEKDLKKNNEDNNNNNNDETLNPVEAKKKKERKLRDRWMKLNKSYE